MSTTEFEDNLIDFREKRREKIIRQIIQTGQYPRNQIENIIKMHEFLTTVDLATREGEMEDEVLEKIEDEVIAIREKFEELFEMMKQELFI